mgnify:CR=1 FL=1
MAEGDNVYRTSEERLWRLIVAAIEAGLVIWIARLVPSLAIFILFVGALLVIATLHTER